jgi:hypothetical protein
VLRLRLLRLPKKKRRDGFPACLAVLKQNVLDLKGPEKLSETPSEAVPSEALSASPRASVAAAGPNARVLPENKSIIIFVSF